jgi:hypothetical protein
VDKATALRAVKDQLAELPFEIGLHVQQFEAKHLRVNGERVGSVEASLESLVDERVGLGGLLTQRSNRTLEDVALLPRHLRMLMVSRTGIRAPLWLVSPR